MLKKVGAAAALVLSLGIVPMAGHADQTNVCVANDAAAAGVASFGALTCTYPAGSATGQITQSTPNHVTITYVDDEGVTQKAYEQDTLTVPGQITFAQPVGKVMTVTVGPDSPGFGEGSIGLVIAGDAN